MLSFKQFIVESIIHPKPDDNGNPVRLHSPSTSSPIEHLNDPTKKATIIPNQELPEHLNNIPFKKWENHPRTPEEWNAVDGQGDFNEPPMKKTTKKLASGVIIHEKDGRIWTIHPSNGFGGYNTTIGPKGRIDKGINMRANAIKEAMEETGLKVRLLGHAHDSDRTTTLTRYYHAERVGGHPSNMGWESQAVSLVPKEQLEEHLNSPLDKEIARKIHARV